MIGVVQKLRKRFENEEEGRRGLRGGSGVAGTGNDSKRMQVDKTVGKEEVGLKMKWGAKSSGREYPAKERSVKTTSKVKIYSLGPDGDVPLGTTSGISRSLDSQEETRGSKANAI